jgi:hypothetical protein
MQQQYYYNQPQRQRATVQGISFTQDATTPQTIEPGHRKWLSLPKFFSIKD